MRTLVWTAVPALLMLVSSLFADPTKAEKIVKDELEKVKADPNLARLIKDEALDKTFPGQTFFAVTFRQFPVARLAPEPLKSSNVYAVTAEGKPVLINSMDGLQKFFSEGKIGAKEDVRKDAVRAFLALAQELAQDGFYRFKLEPGSLKADGEKASGKVVVAQGGNGEISVTLNFKDGVFSSAQPLVQIKPGMRPRCQATLLLDPNPLVRQIAEDSLLVMGRPALPYLAEQYAKAKPDLQKAIERVRQRILSEDR